VSNRWLRFVIALLAIVASVAAGFRISQLEQQLVSDVSRSRAGEVSAQTAIESLGDLKAALHAYVAPGQNHTFWTARVGMFMDKVRSALLELDGAATAAGAPVTDTLATLDKLGTSEQRARSYIVAGQTLLAGDVIFADARDLLDGMRVQIAHARGEVAQAAAARQAGLRREQWMLALGGVGILALAVLVLVPPVRAPESAGAIEADATASTMAAAEDVEYARVISKAPAPPNAASAAPASRPSTTISRPATTSSGTRITRTTTTGAPSSSATSKPATPAASDAPPVPAAAPPAPPAPPPTLVHLADAAAVCVDLARLSDSGQISKLLERAAAVLNATGLVVWMASEDRSELFPAAAAGYDERLFSRIGSIPRDASNLTGAAFRDGTAKTSPGSDSASAAIAVPLVTPDGPVGVLSGELKALGQVDPSRLAVATIFAAQLSMLLGSMTVATSSEVPTQSAQGR
jgi:hypothetical protein